MSRGFLQRVDTARGIQGGRSGGPRTRAKGHARGCVGVGAHRFHKGAESLSSAESLVQECWGGQVALGGSMHLHYQFGGTSKVVA